MYPAGRCLLAAAVCCLAAAPAPAAASLYDTLFGPSASLCTEATPLSARCSCPREVSRLYQGADCSARNISQLPAELVLPAGLPTVSFERNNLTVVRRDQFRANPTVTRLRLSKNRIEAIEARAFSALSGLDTLLLDKNMIAELDSSAFAGLLHLERLDLGFNRLRRLEPGLFADTALRDLQLHYNPLVTLDPHLLLHVPSLQRLDLDSTDLAELPAGLFVASQQLTVLLLPHNELTAVPAAALAEAASLHTLDLSGNKLDRLPAAAFAGSPRMRRLVLSSMKTLQRVEAHAFSGLDGLQELLCQYNPALAELSDAAFRDADSGRHLASLTLVDFKHDALSHLSADLLPWDKMEYVDFEMNPWSCDCDMAWVAQGNYSFKEEPLFKCDQPEAVAGRAVSSLTAEEFVCDDEATNIALIVCLTLLGVGAAAGIGFAIWKFNVCHRAQEKMFSHHKYSNVPVRTTATKIEVEGMEWDKSDMGF